MTERFGEIIEWLERVKAELASDIIRIDAAIAGLRGQQAQAHMNHDSAVKPRRKMSAAGKAAIARAARLRWKQYRAEAKRKAAK